MNIRLALKNIFLHHNANIGNVLSNITLPPNPNPSPDSLSFGESVVSSREQPSCTHLLGGFRQTLSALDHFGNIHIYTFSYFSFK